LIAIFFTQFEALLYEEQNNCLSNNNQISFNYFDEDYAQLTINLLKININISLVNFEKQSINFVIKLQEDRKINLIKIYKSYLLTIYR